MTNSRPRCERPGTLAEEIGLLRELLRQMQERVEDEQPLKELIALAESLGRTTTRIAALLRAERSLGEGPAVDALLGQLVARLQPEQGQEVEQDD